MRGSGLDLRVWRERRRRPALPALGPLVCRKYMRPALCAFRKSAEKQIRCKSAPAGYVLHNHGNDPYACVEVASICEFGASEGGAPRFPRLAHWSAENICAPPFALFEKVPKNRFAAKVTPAD